jgi:hypothetical protein
MSSSAARWLLSIDRYDFVIIRKLIADTKISPEGTR